MWFKEEPSQFSMGRTAQSNLFHHGETTYRVEWMSENHTLVFLSKELCFQPIPFAPRLFSCLPPLVSFNGLCSRPSRFGTAKPVAQVPVVQCSGRRWRQQLWAHFLNLKELKLKLRYRPGNSGLMARMQESKRRDGDRESHISMNGHGARGRHPSFRKNDSQQICFKAAAEILIPGRPCQIVSC